MPPQQPVVFNFTFSLFLTVLTLFTPPIVDFLITFYLVLHDLVLLIQLDFKVPSWVWALLLCEAALLWRGYAINYDLPGGFL
jgi:hypothetical protein